MISTFIEAALRSQTVNQSFFTIDMMTFFGTRLGVMKPAPYGAYFSYVNTKNPTGARYKVAYINDAGYVNPTYSGELSGHLPREEWDDLMNTVYPNMEAANAAASAKAKEAWANK